MSKVVTISNISADKIILEPSNCLLPHCKMKHNTLLHLDNYETKPDYTMLSAMPSASLNTSNVVLSGRFLVAHYFCSHFTVHSGGERYKCDR